MVKVGADLWEYMPMRSGLRSMTGSSLQQLVSDFRRQVAMKLGRGGNPEDQLRGPLEDLIRHAGTLLGLRVTPYGEVTLRAIQSRPDYAIDVERSRIGYIELKAPGKSVPGTPLWKPDKRERQQFERLRELPNLIYSDGTDWVLYQLGQPVGDVVHLDCESASLTAFETLISSFLSWAPERPRSLRELIRVTAGLCRLLKTTVLELTQAESGDPEIGPFTQLAEDWRHLLFPKLTDEEFADAYAQTVTFGLLLARESGIDFSDHDLLQIANKLGKQHLLLGSALGHLANPHVAEQLTILGTLREVIGVADWSSLPAADRTAYWDLYELFLEEYDPALRKRSGSYYTPEPVARFMVSFVDQILKTRMRTKGFADHEVVALDPAMGTGTFLVEILRSVAKTVGAQGGDLAAKDHLRELYRSRLIGFERSVAPFAVAELRLHQTLREIYQTEVPKTGRRFLIDTLDDPDDQFIDRGLAYRELQRARNEANHVKRKTKIEVVIGNPPFLERAKKQDPAPWLERRRDRDRPLDLTRRPSLDEFRSPDHSRLAYKLANTAIYFWRWATWKVFDAHPRQPAGIVAFVSTAAYLRSDAFTGMRRYLRSTADEAWIIDLSPEGHQPKGSTRIFPEVQHEICIGIFARYGPADVASPAEVHYTAVHGDREEKFEALNNQVPLDENGPWRTCPSGWADPFVPVDDTWLTYPAFLDLMPWSEPGVKTNRTWVHAPDRETLLERWRRLTTADFPDVLFKATDTLTPRTRVAGLPRLTESEDLPVISAYGFRSFDRQYIFNDPRLIDRRRDSLWDVAGPDQIYIATQHNQVISTGPGLVFTRDVPDQHHFNGRGGRIVPLYRDATGRTPNLLPHLLTYLSKQVERRISADDFVAYLASVVAHPGYTSGFAGHLGAQHGIRIPLTADHRLWDVATEIGKQIVNLHTRPNSGLPARARPKRVAPIPDTEDGMPDKITYDAATCTLHVGSGAIAPVNPDVYTYTVGGGVSVINRWFSYRRGTRPSLHRAESRLDDTRAARWSVQFTEDLLDLVQVLTLLVEFHPTQQALLEEVVTGPLISAAGLTQAGVLPVPAHAAQSPRPSTQESLF